MKKMTKCINCGGGLIYSPTKASIICEHCDSKYPMPAAKRAAKLVRKYALDYVPETDEKFDNMFVCNTCNSLHMVADGKTSTRCPSCGDTNIVKSSSKTCFPDGLIPFTLEKENAVSIFEKWLKKRRFAPNDLFALAKNGKISKVYVPAFNITGTSVCAYSAMVKKVHTDNDSGTIFSTMHTVQNVERDQITNHALCANSVVDKKLFEKVSSVDPSKIVPFSTEYLFGYYGADTNCNIHDLMQNFKKDLEDDCESSVRSKLNNKYDEIVHLSCSTELRDVVFNYVYVPVYMNHFTYKNKKYHCYISGTSGKVAGVAPKSAGKILAFVGAILLGIAAVVIALI